MTLDMWDPYVASLRDHLPKAEQKIVFDKFHIAKHLGEAVDRVRRREHKVLKAEGDERLTGTKYDWLRNPASMDEKQRREFAELRRSELKTARAWALRETAMGLYNYVYEKPARKHFQWWYSWAVRSRLQPIKEVASMLKRRFRKHHHLLTASDHQCCQRIAQCQDPVGGIHSPRIPELLFTRSTFIAAAWI